MIVRALAVGAALVLMGAMNAQAQDDEYDEYEEEYSFDKESSTYMELTFSGGYFDINDDDGENRWSGGVGALFGGHVGGLGMEVQYEWFDYSSTHLATYNLRYTFSQDTRIQPYAKLGIGVMGGRPSHPFLLMGRFDAGANFFINEQWALAPSLGYAIASHSNDIFMGTLRVVYYFE